MESNATSMASKMAITTGTEEIPPELLTVITAAVTAFLGISLRIRTLGLVHPGRESVSRWTRQGRAIVQASHNIRPKR